MKNIKEDLDITFDSATGDQLSTIHKCSLEIFKNNSNNGWILLKERNRNLLLIRIESFDDLLKLLKNFEEPVKAVTYISEREIEKNLTQIKGTVRSVFKGTCEAIGQSSVTYIIKKIKGLPAKKDSNLIVRFDMYSKGKGTIITNEPTNKYNLFLRMRKEQLQRIQEIHEDDALGLVVIWGMFITTVILGIIIAFGMVNSLVSKSKRENALEKKLEKIINKKFRIYTYKDPAPNAFCMISPIIFVSDSLKGMLTERELMAVLLHEASHINNKDVIVTISATNGFIALLLGILTSLVLTSVSGPAIVITMVVLMLCRSLGLMNIIWAKTFGRYAEKRSDSYAAKYGYGKELISALTKIEHWLDKLSQKRPCGTTCNIMKKVGDYIDEHPKLKERIENILKSDKNIDVLTGNMSYMKKVSYLKAKLMESK